MKFRKKPVVIEAFKWSPGKFYRHAATLDIDIHVLGMYTSSRLLHIAYFNRRYKMYQGGIEFIQMPKDTSLWEEVIYEA